MMIFGIGHDIVENKRIAELLAKYGDRFVRKILSVQELQNLQNKKDQVRYIAKRFATKEAFSKACGTGITTPVLLQNISVLNDKFGKPYFVFSNELNSWLIANKIKNCHVSITDERLLSSAFVVLEQ